MTKTQKIATFVSTVGSALLAFPTKILANGNSVTILPSDGNYTRLTGIRIGSIMSTFITILLGVAGVLSFIFLLWGGLQWILSGGDKEGTEKARKRITAALIGLAIVFSAYALIWIVGALFGINGFTNFTLPVINNV